MQRAAVNCVEEVAFDHAHMHQDLQSNSLQTPQLQRIIPPPLFSSLGGRLPYSSSAGISSSIYRINVTLISVLSFPRSTSLTNLASTCICTISNAPLNTPQKIFENHSSSCARPSSGSSTKSASGFSSKIREKDLLSAVQLVMVGVMLRKILNPTCGMV